MDPKARNVDSVQVLTVAKPARGNGRIEFGQRHEPHERKQMQQGLSQRMFKRVKESRDKRRLLES